MKKLSLFLALMAIAAQANAQFTASLSFNFRGSSSSELHDFVGQDPDSKLSSSSFVLSVAPSVRYQISDKWEAGLQIGVETTLGDSRKNWDSPLYSSNITKITPTIFGRRSFNLTDKLSLFAQCNLGFSYTNYTREEDKNYKQSITGLSISLFPGLVYKLTDKFYVEAKLPWPKIQCGIENSKIIYSNNTSNGGKRGVENTQIDFAFAPSSGLGSIIDNTSIGISYHF